MIIRNIFVCIVASLLSSGCKTTNKSADAASGMKTAESINSKKTATCLLEGGVWMSAPQCLPLNADGKSVTFQGQTCSTIALCTDDNSTKTATCLLEGGVWMYAPPCLPLDPDGNSVTFQGQTCSMIAMCGDSDTNDSGDSKSSYDHARPNIRIESARYNSSKKAIDLKVTYGGGCKDHEFKIILGPCQESAPVSCVAKLIDLTEDDICEAIVSKTVSISLTKAGLAKSYFSGGTIDIYGAQNTKATVKLPGR